MGCKASSPATKQEEVLPAAKPKLFYYPIAARGELIRMIADVGGVPIDEELDCDEKEKAAYGSPGSLPVLSHGNLKMAQSLAIELYMTSISPKYRSLNDQQKARDTMFCAIKEDVLSAVGKVIFSSQRAERAPDEIPKICNKWFPIIEGLVPEKGFINGLDYPTPADLAVLNMATAYMPFCCAYRLGNYDWSSKYPKMKELADRTKMAPELKNYMDTSKTRDAAARVFEASAIPIHLSSRAKTKDAGWPAKSTSAEAPSDA
eukprot:CAMPEP_0171127238 /NCGR_PEP_ID=MMETSP0766_2-20121228/114909_1 /TAXON_ID=439317 /ORGANISM="Gambierdiscus australes, Strain CAWD 149" /LENGTH=260 /DNA_ID=CAMNT_0011590329 /DNA_START=1 /DNA_END=780 /DNA_ORIENTATION=-